MEDHTDGKQKHGSEGLDRLIHGELTTAHLSSRAMWRVLPPCPGTENAAYVRHWRKAYRNLKQPRYMRVNGVGIAF